MTLTHTVILQMFSRFEVNIFFPLFLWETMQKFYLVVLVLYYLDQQYIGLHENNSRSYETS